MYSAHQETADIVAEFGTLYEGFLTTPFTHKQLYAVIETALTKRRENRIQCI
ncbi:hypothetical protein L1S32_11175 [Methanogenium sp. S4BF]|uniref:hypothetical protein n=1 Tax=Methanogenium sp. S4BF TaxID=1789226 RepID=UPI0024160389|nr:hypothetical protein [Methanogenium sp. S4BF]WFN34387.1 hypothetical protein L1S32_11175 [Methanogenium sp. S4BF]